MRQILSYCRFLQPGYAEAQAQSRQWEGAGKSILSQASKTPNSQVSSSQSSSAFELLASEVTSQQEEVVKQSQASQQEVGEDLASWDILLLQKRFWIMKLMLLKTSQKKKLIPSLDIILLGCDFI